MNGPTLGEEARADATCFSPNSLCTSNTGPSSATSMSGGGWWLLNGNKVHFGFQLGATASSLGNELELDWKDAAGQHNFALQTLSSLTYNSCGNETQVTGEGTGWLQGNSASISFSFITPNFGAVDVESSTTSLCVDSLIARGNIQAQ
jgi:hypothetical protein